MPAFELLLVAVLGSIAVVVAGALVDGVQWIWLAGLGIVMAAISVSDARRFIVPDVLSLPAIPAGLLASGSFGGWYGSGIVNSENLVAMALGAGALYGIRQAYAGLRGREGLGLGDVKLAAVAGAWTGIAGLIHVTLLAALAALGAVALFALWQVLAGPGRASTIDAATAIPFGAFLAPAIWFVAMANATTVV